MKVEDLRRQKPCYIHNLHVGDTFLLEGELYYICSCNNAEQIIRTINLITNSIHLFDIRYLKFLKKSFCFLRFLYDI